MGIALSAPSSPSPFLHFICSAKSKTTYCEPHIGLHLKSIKFATFKIAWKIFQLDFESGGNKWIWGHVSGGHVPPPPQRRTAPASGEYYWRCLLFAAADRSWQLRVLTQSPLTVWGLGPPLASNTWGHTSVSAKWHLIPFNSFSWVHKCETDR